MAKELTYDSLAAGDGKRLFGDSWTAYAMWLDNLESMDAPTGHKLWAFTSYLSMLTNNASQHVYVPRLGHLRLNLGVMYVGQIQTIIENLIKTVQLLSNQTRIPLAPPDTDGHRQGLISALSGYSPVKRKKVSGPIGPKGVKVKESIPVDVGMEQILKQFSETSTDSLEEAREVGMFDFPRRPTALIVPHLRSFLKDSYAELSQMLVQCLLNQPIDIQQQMHRYRIAKPALSILSAINTEDLIGRSNYVNKQFLANMIPVYNSSHYGSSFRAPDPASLADVTEWSRDAAGTILHEHEYTLTPAGLAAFNKVSEARILTTDLNMMGLSDRRLIHLIRIAGIIAFSRKAPEVDKNDIMLAHTLLTLNETTAELCYSALLAERGDARIFVKITEYVEVHKQVTLDGLVAFLRSNTNLQEFALLDSINRFIHTDRLHETESGRVELNTFGAKTRVEALALELLG